jgi:hypothetical protein
LLQMAMVLPISTESSSAPYRGDALFHGCSSLIRAVITTCVDQIWSTACEWAIEILRI